MFSENQHIKYKRLFDPSCQCWGNNLTKNHLFKILSINETYATIIRVGAEYEGVQNVPITNLEERYESV
ncbi:MAG: hypothetical protein EKK57_05850 [Proteobacteria bacterium]|jgi:hypothetical protein|nr:MAG: hypothetical protein EKK57_05850 [Pseudomonadota bacterium]